MEKQMNILRWSLLVPLGPPGPPPELPRPSERPPGTPLENGTTPLAPPPGRGKRPKSEYKR